MQIATTAVLKDILSISVKAYGTPKVIAKVSKRYFTPAPKVDSAIIRIGNINKDNFKGIKEKDFFELVRTAFGQKRKTLGKNLLNLGINKEEIAQKLEEYSIPAGARAEDLSLETFLALTKTFFPQNTR